MKKLASLFLLLIPYFGFSQFILTEDGLINKNDSTKNYVVLEFKGKTKEELFKLTKNVITKHYVSPKSVISESAPDIISINGRDEVPIKNIKLYMYDMRYVLLFSFKDEKIKIDFNIIKMNYLENNLYIKKPEGALISIGIYNKKGKLVYPEAKKHIESIPNIIIAKLKQGVSTEEDW